MFNYASFMWDQSDIWPSNQSSRWPGHDMMSMGEAPRNEWDVYSVVCPSIIQQMAVNCLLRDSFSGLNSGR